MYVFCVVCYHLITASYVSSVGGVLAHHYTLVDHSALSWTMSWLYDSMDFFPF